MSTGEEGEGTTAGDRPPPGDPPDASLPARAVRWILARPVSLAVAATVAAAALLAWGSSVSERQDAGRRAKERALERLRDAAVVRDIAVREIGRPAPASGVRLVLRTLVRCTSERSRGYLDPEWSPGGEFFVVRREDYFPLLGFRRDQVRRTAEFFTPEGEPLLEVSMEERDRYRGSVWVDPESLFSFSSKAVLTVEDDTVRVVDLTGRETARIGSPAGHTLSGATFDARGRIVAWGGSVVVMSGAEGSGRREYAVEEMRLTPIQRVVPSPSGDLALLDAGNRWTAGRQFVLDLSSGKVHAVANPSKGGDSPGAIEWIPGTEQVLLVFSGYNSVPKRFVVVGADGASVATAPGVCAAVALPGGEGVVSHSDDGALRFWDLRGKEVRSFPAGLDRKWYSAPWQEGEVLAVSPRGDMVATLRHADGAYVQLWSATGERLARAAWPETPGRLAFSPSGDRILVGNASGSVCVWEIVRAVPPK